MKKARQEKKEAIAIALVYYFSEYYSKKKSKNRKWQKNWLEKRREYTHMNLLKELKECDPDDFKNYLRMNKNDFSQLLELLRPYLTRKDTKMRESISAEERLAATLRFLATGRSYEDLKFSTAISAQALGYIIPETCRVIFEVLGRKYMKFPRTTEDWRDIANSFNSKWQVPNCGGAIDGKHIRIIPPPGSGAFYYNYKHFYSIILMAIVNANYEFIYVDVGRNGRMSDGSVIEYTTFYEKLTNNKLNLPENSENKENLNFVFLSDDAFALQQHILKPFPQKDLSHNKRIFNYRLSRGRNVVENAFGLIAARFRILHSAINILPERINYVILAICVLHNFLSKTNPKYISTSTFDRENSNHEIMEGDWRRENFNVYGLQASTKRNIQLEAKENRNRYLEYFNGVGKVEWQDEMVRRGKA